MFGVVITRVVRDSWKKKVDRLFGVIIPRVSQRIMEEKGQRMIRCYKNRWHRGLRKKIGGSVFRKVALRAPGLGGTQK